MARCVYCGKPARLLRTYHEECKELHDRAVAKIPHFFQKLIETSLPIDRFRELLLEAAQASHIAPEELRRLILDGIVGLMDATLERRLLTLEEEDRIITVLEAFGFTFDDDLKPYDILIKVDVLRDLGNGIIPDRVSLADPLPVELQKTETVVWAFNHIKVHRKKLTDNSEDAAETKNFTGHYIPKDAFAKMSPPARTRESAGDLLVTSKCLHFFSIEHQPRRVALARIVDVKPATDGIEIIYRAKHLSARLVQLDDPWFATNLIIGLVGQAQKMVNADARD